ncbi:hypothetical protein [Streptomyces sp. NPDC060194]|uniref:hypothetical protein n=1 Tax=Streptomyces sp. NPDC060194 TaxID=3347069 RepID=UPI003651FFA8
MTEPMTVQAALTRLRQYEERPSPTWSTASYGGGAAESALVDIARTLAAEVERLHAEKATPLPGAKATRREQLLAAIQTEGGGWTPKRALAFYQRLGADVSKQSTAKADLIALVASGDLRVHDVTTKDGELARRTYRLVARARRGDAA